jgi:hypothetical protein
VRQDGFDLRRPDWRQFAWFKAVKEQLLNLCLSGFRFHHLPELLLPLLSSRTLRFH